VEGILQRHFLLFRTMPTSSRSGSASAPNVETASSAPRSSAEARSIAAQDSHHRRGIRTMEVLEWNPHRAFRMDKLTIADVERMARGE